MSDVRRLRTGIKSRALRGISPTRGVVGLRQGRANTRLTNGGQQTSDSSREQIRVEHGMFPKAPDEASLFKLSAGIKIAEAYQVAKMVAALYLLSWDRRSQCH